MSQAKKVCLFSDVCCAADVDRMRAANGSHRASPKTHGHIVPWNPPRFGISEDVLRRLADRLEAEAIHLAKEQTAKMGNVSQQSSRSSDRTREWFTLRDRASTTFE